MSILDNTKEITDEYLIENGWEKICYENGEINSIFGDIKYVWLYKIEASRARFFRKLSFYILYEPIQKKK